MLDICFWKLPSDPQNRVSSEKMKTLGLESLYAYRPASPYCRSGLVKFFCARMSNAYAVRQGGDAWSTVTFYRKPPSLAGVFSHFIPKALKMCLRQIMNNSSTTSSTCGPCRKKGLAHYFRSVLAVRHFDMTFRDLPKLMSLRHYQFLGISDPLLLKIKCPKVHHFRRLSWKFKN